jgi:OmpA-OmpF porin, OOP family
MQFRQILAAATAAGLLAAAPTLAQPITGPYVSLGAGPSIFQDQSIKSAELPALGLTSNSVGHVSYDIDYGVEGGVGWGFGNGFRAELSGTYLHGNEDKFGGAKSNGFAEAWGGFGNVLYDFDLAPFGAPGLAPYIGAGVGYEAQHFSTGTVVSDGITLQPGGTRGDFAIDAIVGIAYTLPFFPALAVTAEYRFTTIPESQTFGGDGFNAAGNESPLRFKADNLYTHTGLVGLRLALWQPEPPPPPAPPPPPPAPPPVTEARTYLVFFDWDRADLTARAKQIVSEAAQASTHVQTTKIEVNGYTDLSGTTAYNQRLSVRRAQSVEAELIRDGVAQNEIEIHGYGESNPLVPTAKGVREPQNRRVEIILK